MRSFVKIKSSRNFEIILSFTDLGKPCQSRDFYVANMSFNATRENKILEFTVNDCLQVAVNSAFVAPLYILDMKSGTKHIPF